MNIREKIVQIIDRIINLLFLLCFVPMVLFAAYSIWDNLQINKAADAAQYKTYRPTEDALSFAELRQKNKEVFGWITIEKTNIDYPLLQGKDNNKYVNTDALGAFSLSGSLFLDSRNSKVFRDFNHIIYGHYMEKEAMFGQLSNYLEKEWFDSHKDGKLFYKNRWHNVEYFAFLEVDAYDTTIYNPEIRESEAQTTFLRYVKENAIQYYDIALEEEVHLVTLSTCTSDTTNKRHILIGKINDK